MSAAGMSGKWLEAAAWHDVRALWDADKRIVVYRIYSLAFMTTGRHPQCKRTVRKHNMQ